MAMLASLADRQGMSKSAVLRQALRLYQAKAMEWAEPPNTPGSSDG